MTLCLRSLRYLPRLIRARSPPIRTRMVGYGRKYRRTRQACAVRLCAGSNGKVHRRLRLDWRLRDRRALVSPGDGSIDWLCWPRFDSGAVFAALLGGADNGHWSIGPTDPDARISRRYRGNTLILETQFDTATGGVTLIDFMPLRFSGTSHLVRIVRGRHGRVQMNTEFVLRFDYGSIVPWITRLDDHSFQAIAGPRRSRSHTVVSRGLARGTFDGLSSTASAQALVPALLLPCSVMTVIMHRNSAGGQGHRDARARLFPPHIDHWPPVAPRLPSPASHLLRARLLVRTWFAPACCRAEHMCRPPNASEGIER